jgi:hypothetical protein
MLDWSDFVHAHIKPQATIVETDNGDLRLIMECSNLKSKYRPSVGCSAFRKDDHRMVFITVLIVKIYLPFYFFKSLSPSLLAFPLKKHTLDLRGYSTDDWNSLNVRFRHE